GCNGGGGIAYGGGIFIVAGSGTANQKVATSPDAVSWGTPTSLPSSPYHNVDGVFHLNDAFFILNNDGSGDRRIYHSTSGASWLQVFDQANGGGLTGMAYGNGTYVAVGYGNANDHVVTSSNGTTWTPRNAPQMMSD